MTLNLKKSFLCCFLVIAAMAVKAADTDYGLIFNVANGKFYLNVDGDSDPSNTNNTEYSGQTYGWNSTEQTLSLTNFIWGTTAPVSLNIVNGDLTLDLSGTSSFSGVSCGILSLNTITVVGSGSINVIGTAATESYGIRCNKITISGGTLEAKGYTSAILCVETPTFPSAFFWTKSADYDGGSPSTGRVPDDQFTIDSNVKYVKIATIPPLQGTVTILGTAVFGAELSASSNITSADPGTLSYQWKRDSENVGSGSTNYVITTDDIGKTIKVEVSAANYSGSITSEGKEADKASTTTSLTLLGTSTYGKPLPFSVTVQAVPPGSGTPTGTVTVFIKVPAILVLFGFPPLINTGPIPLDNNGKIEGANILPFLPFALPASPANNNYLIYAVYNGDGNFKTSSSADANHSVEQETPTINGPKLFTATYGQTLQDISSQLQLLTGSDDDPSIPGTFSWDVANPSLITVGNVNDSPNVSYTLKFYPDDGNNYSVVDDIATIITVSKKSVTFTGTVSATKVYDGNINFDETQITINNVGNFDGKIGTDDVTLNKSGVTGTFGPNVGTGTLVLLTNFSLTGAKASNYLLLSQPTVTTSITKANTITTLISDLNPSDVGQMVKFTVTVTGTGVIPSEDVELRDGGASGALLGTATLDASGVVTFDISTLSAVTHSITAHYLGNSNYFSSISNTVDQIVNKLSPTLSFTVNPENSIIYGDNVTFTATLSGSFPNDSGKLIEFIANGSNIGTATTNSSGIAVFTLIRPSAVTYIFKAIFAGDDSNNPASTTEISGYVVNPKEITVTANSGSSIYGQKPSNPEFSATGLVNGESESMLTGLYNDFYITSTTPPDPYSLEVKGELTNGNYKVTTFNTGIWRVYKITGAQVSGELTVSGVATAKCITLNSINLINNQGNQTVEYAISSSDGFRSTNAPVLVWQSDTVFTGDFSEDLIYYAYARSAENRYYYPGEQLVSSEIKISKVTTGINEILPENTLRAWMQDGTLNVSGLTIGKTWSIYNLAGMLLHQNTAINNIETLNVSSLSQTRGIFIIKSDDRTLKIVF